MKRLEWIVLFIPFICFADPFDEMLLLYQKYGKGEYMIQELVTQENHVRQAAYFANQAGAPEEVIIGLLFHDIGQLVIKEYIGRVEILHPHHAEIGENWLRERGFPPYICDWVRNHAMAKIVLCMMDPNYYESLSLASQISYHYQKAKYDETACSGRLEEFLEHPRKRDFLAFRKCDDMAKVVGLKTPHLESYREMTRRVLEGYGRDATNDQWIESIEKIWVNQSIPD